MFFNFWVKNEPENFARNFVTSWYCSQLGHLASSIPGVLKLLTRINWIMPYLKIFVTGINWTMPYLKIFVLATLHSSRGFNITSFCWKRNEFLIIYFGKLKLYFQHYNWMLIAKDNHMSLVSIGTHSNKNTLTEFHS